jgi:two-component system nitrate/nitrite response regulator NarL
MIDDQPGMLVVGEAADEQAAVELVRALVPHVVVLDVNMAREDGIEATRTLAAEAPHVKVIALSVPDDAEAVAAMRSAGAAEYLPKGGEAETLFATIRRVAAARR